MEKRGFYKVISYDRSISKVYWYYKAAYKYASKLIAQDINCGIYDVDGDMLIGC